MTPAVLLLLLMVAAAAAEAAVTTTWAVAAAVAAASASAVSSLCQKGITVIIVTATLSSCFHRCRLLLVMLQVLLVIAAAVPAARVLRWAAAAAANTPHRPTVLLFWMRCVQSIRAAAFSAAVVAAIAVTCLLHCDQLLYCFLQQSRQPPGAVTALHISFQRCKQLLGYGTSRRRSQPGEQVQYCRA